MSKRAPSNKPFRKVLGSAQDASGATIEALECGHTFVSKSAVRAPLCPSRRRCPHCEDEMSFSRWYRIAREYAKDTYGLRGVPVDTWKVMFASSETPQGAAKYLADQEHAYGRTHAF